MFQVVDVQIADRAPEAFVCGRPVTIDLVTATYDALGRMVEQNRSGTYTEIAYAPTGDKLALMSGQTLQKAFVSLPGGATAVYTSSGLDHYRHSDWLGSARLTTTPNRTVSGDVAYAPFGETYAQTGITDFSFTGMNQDVDQNANPAVLYDFPAREYGIQGRWPSPDPAGIGAVDLANPQSWNRYAYVMNNPLALTDPTGLLIEGGDWGDGCGFFDASCGPCDFDPWACGDPCWFVDCGGGGGGGRHHPPLPPPPPPPAGGYGNGIDLFGTWDEAIPGGVQVFPPPFSGINLPSGSGCTYGSGSCGGMIYGWTNVNGQPVGEFDGDQFCTLFSMNGSCLSAVFWFGTSQNGGWSPVDHTTPSQRSKSPAIRKCEDAAAVAAYNKNVSTDINAAKKPIEGALSGAATGCIWGTKWGLGEGCTAGAVGGAAKGAVAGLLTGAWSMIHDAVGPAACKQ